MRKDASIKRGRILLARRKRSLIKFYEALDRDRLEAAFRRIGLELGMAVKMTRCDKIHISKDRRVTITINLVNKPAKAKRAKRTIGSGPIEFQVFITGDFEFYYECYPKDGQSGLHPLPSSLPVTKICDIIAAICFRKLVSRITEKYK